MRYLTHAYTKKSIGGTCHAQPLPIHGACTGKRPVRTLAVPRPRRLIPGCNQPVSDKRLGTVIPLPCRPLWPIYQPTSPPIFHPPRCAHQSIVAYAAALRSITPNLRIFESQALAGAVSSHRPYACEVTNTSFGHHISLFIFCLFCVFSSPSFLMAV